MTPLQALAVLEHVQDCDASLVPCVPEGRAAPLTPLSLAALASLSGALDDAANWDQLVEEIDHGFALVNAEILSFDDWSDEVTNIARHVIRYVEVAANGA
jgi:hypothetical protein